jgi:hypothetical protein
MQLLLLFAGAPLDDCRRLELAREVARAADCYERSAERFATSRALAVESHQSAARCHLARGKWTKAERSLRFVVERSPAGSYEATKAAILLLERDFQKQLRHPKRTGDLIADYERLIARGHPGARPIGVDRIVRLYRRIGRFADALAAEHGLDANAPSPSRPQPL